MNTKSNGQHQMERFWRYRCSMVFSYFGNAPTLENIACEKDESQPRPLFFSVRCASQVRAKKHGQAIPLTHIDTQKWRILSYFVVWISPLFSPLLQFQNFEISEVRGRGGSPKSGCGSVSGWCCDCAGAAADHGTNVGTNVGTPGWEAPSEASDSATTAPFK